MWNVLHRERIKQTINRLKNYLHYIYVFYCYSHHFISKKVIVPRLNTQYRGKILAPPAHGLMCFLRTLLSGCGGGNGVYCFFTVFFLGCLRLERLLWRKLGRNLSQLWVRSSGSFASSRLIINVWKIFNYSSNKDVCLFVFNPLRFLSNLPKTPKKGIPFKGDQHHAYHPNGPRTACNLL